MTIRPLFISIGRRSQSDSHRITEALFDLQTVFDLDSCKKENIKKQDYYEVKVVIYCSRPIFFAYRLTRAYGSLTTFNILFTYKEEQLKGSGKD